MSIDLHCHSRISDGSLGVDELLSIARRRRLTAISITDRDAVVGSTRAVILGKRMGIEVIPGVEFSTRDNARGNKAHLLGYLCDSPDRLEGLCRRINLSRRAAANEMIRKVLRYYPIVPESITRCASGSTTIYKQHIMHALMDAGHADSIYGAVYDKLFSPESGCAYVPVEYPEVREAAQLIRSAGGLVVLAHPAAYHNEALMEELTAEGLLDGVEVWHPDHTAEDAARLAAFAAAHGLLTTGGSDFHGMYSRTARPLGNSDVPENIPQKMRTYKSRRNTSAG